MTKTVASVEFDGINVEKRRDYVNPNAIHVKCTQEINERLNIYVIDMGKISERYASRFILDSFKSKQVYDLTT